MKQTILMMILFLLGSITFAKKPLLNNNDSEVVVCEIYLQEPNVHGFSTIMLSYLNFSENKEHEKIIKNHNATPQFGSKHLTCVSYAIAGQIVLGNIGIAGDNLFNALYLICINS